MFIYCGLDVHYVAGFLPWIKYLLGWIASVFMFTLHKPCHLRNTDLRRVFVHWGGEEAATEIKTV